MQIEKFHMKINYWKKIAWILTRIKFSWLFVYTIRKSRVRAGTSEITFRLIKWRYFSFLAQTTKEILLNSQWQTPWSGCWAKDSLPVSVAGCVSRGLSCEEANQSTSAKRNSAHSLKKRHVFCSNSAWNTTKLFFVIWLQSSDDDGDCKLVVVVRTDLKMGKGKIAAQVCKMGFALGPTCLVVHTHNNIVNHSKWVIQNYYKFLALFLGRSLYLFLFIIANKKLTTMNNF